MKSSQVHNTRARGRSKKINGAQKQTEKSARANVRVDTTSNDSESSLEDTSRLSHGNVQRTPPGAFKPPGLDLETPAGEQPQLEAPALSPRRMAVKNLYLCKI